MAEQDFAFTPKSNRSSRSKLPKAKRKRSRNINIQPYLYLLPALITIGLWIYKPLIETFQLSFYQWNLIPTSPRTYVGLQNYERILTLPEMRQAIRNTVIYILGLLPLSIGIPLIVAIFTDSLSNRWRTLYRTLIFVPMIMAPVVVSIIWRWIIHPTQGVVNVLLQDWFGIDPINFLRDGNLPITTIILITSWQLIGFSTLIFSAAVSNINRDYLEAAAIAGASYWQSIRSIILPLLSPTILFMTTLSILLSSQWTFAYINVLTQGGPINATTNVYYILWEFGFRSFAVGWSSAAAMILFVSFGILAAILLSLTRRLSFYDS